MKVFTAVVAVLAGLTTLVSAIATPQETDVGEFAGASFVLDKLPDGRRRVSLYNDGAFAGSVTEGGPGSTDNLIVADATNTTISAAGLDAVQVADAVNWGPAIAKLGPRFIVSPTSRPLLLDQNFSIHQNLQCTPKITPSWKTRRIHESRPILPVLAPDLSVSCLFLSLQIPRRCSIADEADKEKIKLYTAAFH
jgi:hypothetical protein